MRTVVGRRLKLIQEIYYQESCCTDHKTQQVDKIDIEFELDFKLKGKPGVMY